MRETPFNAEWSLSFSNPFTGETQCIDAKVPGNVAVDLMNAGILPDLYFGSNALVAQEWERTDFTYICEFTAPIIDESERLEIVFDGLDTVADIALNGIAIASVENMFIPHVIDITKTIQKGNNKLTVQIKNVVDFAAERMRSWGTTAFELGNYWDKTPLYVRKAQHMFGWDIAPRILFGGIWRPISFRIHKREEIMPDHFYLATCSVDTEKDKAGIEISFGCTISDKISAGKYEIEVEGKCAESTFTERIRLLSPFGKWFAVVDNPQLWWPRGYGEQNIYEITVRLFRDGNMVDVWKTRAGLRMLTLDFNCDGVDTSKNRFGFVCNGVPIMVRGSNWVPLDALHSEDEIRIPKVLDMFRNTNCNIVRVWGGSVYESEIFYSLCDEYGILVWQDFMLGCAMYPQHEKFRQIIREEAVCIIKKLRHHPSIALWAGDNETDLFMYWRYANAAVVPSDNILTRRVLKEAVTEYDHYRSYLPSSPFIPDDLFLSKRLYRTPEQHLWGPRGYFKADYYAKNSALFASEIGYHGMPLKKSMVRFLSKEKVWGKFNCDEWIVHAANFVDTEKSPMGRRNYLMREQVRHLFGDSVDLENCDDFILASQITQAEAKKYFIEHFRSRKPYKTGIIWWNMIDCWPQFSDAIVDYYFEKKLAYHYIKRVQEPVCLMVREEGEKRELVAVNDTLKPALVNWKMVDIDNNLPVSEGEFIVESNGVFLLRELTKEDGSYLGIKWKIEGKEFFNHYVNIVSGYTYSFNSEVHDNKIETVTNSWNFKTYRKVFNQW